MNAFLILEDGHVFEGKSFGAQKEVICEVVFNTSMTGYLEVLTDPSYQGQGVVMTYPLIGNYGVCLEDIESEKPWHSAFIVREISRTSSNFRREEDLEDYLKEHDIPGICGVDTRAITKILREHGCMGGMITTNPDFNLDEILPKLKEYTVTDAVKTVSRTEKEHFNGDGFKVALLDLGTKNNIIRSLEKRGCDVTVYPADTTAEEILGDQPDGIMLSNGPGDPKECVQIIKEIKKLYDSEVPIFAICLGHQLMALATGADTEKMRWGHRGGNHPVKDLKSGRVYISSQNHGYVIKEETIDPDVAEVSFINVNDKTIEGLDYKNKNIRTVQFHPEACPGPQDTAYLFDEFMDRVGFGFSSILGHSPFAIKSQAAEASVDDRYERAIFKEKGIPSALVARKTIYQQYFKNLNLWGHPYEEQGFQMTPTYWVGHAHNIYLQYGTDFGIVVMFLFILLILWAAIIYIKRVWKKCFEEDVACLLFLTIPATFGMLEYAWGVGSVAILMLFVVWRKAFLDEER